MQTRPRCVLSMMIVLLCFGSGCHLTGSVWHDALTERFPTKGIPYIIPPVPAAHEPGGIVAEYGGEIDAFFVWLAFEKDQTVTRPLGFAMSARTNRSLRTTLAADRLAAIASYVFSDSSRQRGAAHVPTGSGATQPPLPKVSGLPVGRGEALAWVYSLDPPELKTPMSLKITDGVDDLQPPDADDVLVRWVILPATQPQPGGRPLAIARAILMTPVTALLDGLFLVARPPKD